MPREMIKSTTTGEVMVVDREQGLCSPWLNHSQRLLPLDQFELDYPLDPENETDARMLALEGFEVVRTAGLPMVGAGTEIQVMKDVR